MRAVGRPRLNPGEKLDEYVGVAVCAAMREQLEREAHAAGYTSLSRYVREQLFTLALREDARAQDARGVADLDRQLLTLEDSAPQWPAEVRTHVLLLLRALFSGAQGA